MKKKKVGKIGIIKQGNRRRWAGAPEPEFWISEDEMINDMSLLREMEGDETVAKGLEGLLELGYISKRISPKTGKTEYRLNKEVVNKALAALPQEVRDDPRELRIYEDTARICDMNEDMTTLLSVIKQQVNEVESKEDFWISKSADEIIYDSVETITAENIPIAFAGLVAKGFVELDIFTPGIYRYLLNVPAVQSAMDALPPKEGHTKK